jgi:DNA invertase Pin-like site-specific DNA recombinase
MKCAIYARVSTTKQDETLQIPRCEEFAKRHEWEVVKIYQDEASGRDANRPGWKALESDLRRHEFDAIIVTKLDRIMRSLMQLLQIFETFQRYGVMIVTIDQGILDLKSANGRLQVQLLGMLAEWEKELISDRTKEALAMKKAKGIQLGCPAAKLPIHTIALMRVAGRTYGEIGKELNIPPTTIKNYRREICREVDEIKKVVQ